MPDRPNLSGDNKMFSTGGSRRRSSFPGRGKGAGGGRASGLFQGGRGGDARMRGGGSLSGNATGDYYANIGRRIADSARERAGYNFGDHMGNTPPPPATTGTGASPAAPAQPTPGQGSGGVSQPPAPTTGGGGTTPPPATTPPPSSGGTTPPATGGSNPLPIDPWGINNPPPDTGSNGANWWGDYSNWLNKQYQPPVPTTPTQPTPVTPTDPNALWGFAEGSTVDQGPRPWMFGGMGRGLWGRLGRGRRWGGRAPGQGSPGTIRLDPMEWMRQAAPPKDLPSRGIFPFQPGMGGININPNASQGQNNWIEDARKILTDPMRGAASTETAGGPVTAGPGWMPPQAPFDPWHQTREQMMARMPEWAKSIWNRDGTQVGGGGPSEAQMAIWRERLNGNPGAGMDANTGGAYPPTPDPYNDPAYRNQFSRPVGGPVTKPKITNVDPGGNTFGGGGSPDARATGGASKIADSSIPGRTPTEYKEPNIYERPEGGIALAKGTKKPASKGGKKASEIMKNAKGGMCPDCGMPKAKCDC